LRDSHCRAGDGGGQDEDLKWGLTVPELKRALDAGRQRGVEPRALVIINPGNPTGACMRPDNIREVIEFAYREKLVLLVDEVYQVNCYDPSLPFMSFRKTMASMAPEIATQQELFSFHSVSKGLAGECGRRGGFMALTNIGEDVREQLVKRASLSLCSNLPVSVVLLLPVMVRKPTDCGGVTGPSAG
jgi:alanine transaminase